MVFLCPTLFLQIFLALDWRSFGKSRDFLNYKCRKKEFYLYLLNEKGKILGTMKLENKIEKLNINSKTNGVILKNGKEINRKDIMKGNSE